MRVLHVIPALAARYGGPSLAAIGMGHALQDSGVEVFLAATNADGPKVLPVPVGEETLFEGLPSVFFDRHLTESYKYSPDLAAWLHGHVADFDVVHIHGIFSHPCVAAATACRLQGIPYVVRPLGHLTQWSLGQKPLRKRIAWHAGVKAMMEGASAIQYTSAGEKADVEASLGLRHGVVIPLGVPINDVPVDRPNLPYVITMSRIHPVKRIELLVDCFIQATQDEALKDWRLVIAGDGEPWYVNRLIEMVFKARVEDRVLFTGWLYGREKKHVLRDASLFALTSSHENFGVAVAEAMSAGVPVLISKHVELAPDVRRAEAGWVSSLEPADIQHKLRDALLHETLRTRRGENARRLIEQHFTWPRVAEKLITLYGPITAPETAQVTTQAA